MTSWPKVKCDGSLGVVYKWRHFLKKSDAMILWRQYKSLITKMINNGL